MGLQEKRLAKNIQDNVLPGILAEIKSVAGYEPAIHIDWDSFTAYDEYPLSRLELDVLPDLVEVFKRIAIDDMGREALQAGLRSIRMENTDDQNAVEIRFADGEFYHKMQLAGSTYSRYSANQIVPLLEKSL